MQEAKSYSLQILPTASVPSMDAVRKLIAKRIKDLDLDLADISRRLGKNHAYMQQYLTRNIPTKLKEDTRAQLAVILGLDEAVLGAPLRSRVVAPLHEGPYPDPDELSSEDVAASNGAINPDEAPTIGSETGRRGIPKDTLAQLDVTGGMGGGGLTIVSDGVPGKSGMTFAAEHVRDYWRLPPQLMAGMGLRPHDTIVIPVQGDSMSPTLDEGDFVFVDTRHRLPSPDGLYALTDEFGGIVVKRLEVIGRRQDEVVVHVISDNERHPSKERLLSEVYIIGRVVRRFGVIG